MFFTYFNGGKNMPDEEKKRKNAAERSKSGEYKSHKDWMKDNSVMINARLLKSTDADILKYLEGKQKQTEIKKGLRLLIELEKTATENNDKG